MAPTLLEGWAKYVERLDVGRYELEPDTELYFLDQLALALALIDTGLPVEMLGQEWHLHTKKDLGAFGIDGPERIYIAEYHRWIDGDGLLRPPAYQPLVPEVRRLNSILAARRNLGRLDGAAAIPGRAGELVRRVMTLKP